MDTKLTLDLVRGRLADVQALKDDIEARFGAEPSVNLRMEISLGDESVTLTVSDNEVTVYDRKRNQMVAQGDLNLARYAIRGMDDAATDSEAPSA